MKNLEKDTKRSSGRKKIQNPTRTNELHIRSNPAY